MGNGIIFVLAVNIVIWVGITIYLCRLDRKISRLEQEMSEKNK